MATVRVWRTLSAAHESSAAMQKHLEISTQHVPGQQNRSLRAAIPERWAALAQSKRLGLLAGLIVIVAAGLALPVLAMGRPPESANSATQASQATQSTVTTSELGSDIDTYRRAEGGAHGDLAVLTTTPAEQWAAEGIYVPEAPEYVPPIPDTTMSSTVIGAGSVPDNGLPYYADEDGAGVGYTGDGFGHRANGFATRDTDAPNSSAGILVDPALVDGSLHPDSADRTSSSAITDEAARLADGFGYYGEQP